MIKGGYEGVYSDFKGSVDNRLLNIAYGDKGRTFETLDEAMIFKSSNPQGKISRLVDYFPHQVIAGCPPRVVEDAKPRCVGYLVSLVG